MKLAGGHVWIASPARNALLCLDAKDGHIEGEQRWQADQPWSVREDTLFIAGEEGIDALQVR